MQQLNLLSDKDKKDFSYVLKLRFIVFFSIWVSFCFLLFLIILIFSNYYLERQASDLKSQFGLGANISKDQKIKNLEDASAIINKNLNKINLIQSQSLPLYDVLKSLTLSLSGIKFQEIDFSPSAKQVILGGFSATRDDLLNFKSSLEKNNYFSSVDLPIYLLAKQTDINFSIILKLK